VLYEAQPFEDDFTGPHFLAELELNRGVRPRAFRALVADTVGVGQQLSLVTATALLFYCAAQGRLHPAALLRLDAALLAAGALLRAALRGPAGGAQAAREAAVLACGSWALSPLLASLTSNVSGDTVAACAAAAFVLHLYLHDYSLRADVAATLPGSASLGGALTGVTLLASRLPSTPCVTAALLFSLQAFVAWPFLRRDLVRASRRGALAAALALHCATLTALARVSRLLAAVLAAALLALTLGCPAALVRCHRLKRRINGPWDEATLTGL